MVFVRSSTPVFEIFPGFVMIGSVRLDGWIRLFMFRSMDFSIYAMLGDAASERTSERRKSEFIFRCR